MRTCEKVKGNCQKNSGKLESNDNNGCKYSDKLGESTMLGDNYRMTKIFQPGCKTKIIIVAEL